MKNETEKANDFEWIILIALTAFIMSLSSCSAIKKIEHNVDANYREKNHLPQKEKTKPQLAKF